MNFFDFINAINVTKVDLIKEDPHNEKDYNAFMVNRGLSLFPDTIFFANEMNRYANTPKDWQFAFYLNAIKQKKRFSKWHKKDKDSDDIKLVMQAYNYSALRASEALSLISTSQLQELRAAYSTGGK